MMLARSQYKYSDEKRQKRRDSLGYTGLDALSIAVSGVVTDYSKDEPVVIARPSVAVPRLSLSSTGKVLYTLNTT